LYNKPGGIAVGKEAHEIFRKLYPEEYAK